jgi:DNA-binding GntR family transcriptional regulator
LVERDIAVELRIAVKSVQQHAVEKLRAAILSGFFKPGDRLIEMELCARLGISRPSIREALRSLESEGLIEIIPNRGPQVPVLTWHQAEEIYRVRALLEGEAAALCAKRARPEQIEGMRQALADFEHAVRNEDSVRRLSATAEFYRIMQEAAGNNLIDELLRRLLARINMLRAQSMSRAGRAKFSFKEMRAMFQAISKGDSRAARKAAETHVKNASLAAHLTVKNAEAERKVTPLRRQKVKNKDDQLQD